MTMRMPLEIVPFSDTLPKSKVNNCLRCRNEISPSELPQVCNRNIYYGREL